MTVKGAVSILGAEPWSAVGRGRRAGDAVVVVHGFTGNPIATRPLGQHLAAEGYTVEVPLLPGHGTSHRDLAVTRYDDWYGALDSLLDHLLRRCRQVAVVGHSMGGTLALDLGARRPDDVAAVAVINPTVRAPTGLLPRLAGALQYVVPFIPRELAGMPANDLVQDGVEEGSYGLVATRAAHSLLAELDRVRAGLLDLTAPLLVVRSTVDHTVDPGNAREVLEFAASRDLRELVCRDSYHVPQLDVDAAVVAATLSSFLDDVLEPGRS